MTKLCRILQIFLFLAAVAGATGVFLKISGVRIRYAPRKEYDLELRYVINLPLPETLRNREEKAEKKPFDRIPQKFRELICRKGNQYGIPPEIIAGIIARESHFDPRCLSPDGGRGLMQLMPAVCRAHKCADPFDPESNIEAGTAHLAALKKSFSHVSDPQEQLKFAIAAYNGGAGHIADARALARKLDLDPGRWEGNVEESVKFLKFRSFYKSSRHGYCNGTLVANYTNSVLALAERFRNE